MSNKAELADSILVRNQEIPVTVTYLPQSQLLFYPDNPRIYTMVRANGKTPSQEEIQSRLSEMDHVRELRKDIKRNGGLMEPLLVRDESFEVLEGNSRLAAYRLLSREDPIKWSKVKCKVLPKAVGDSLVFAILGQNHIRGKKDWQPYEQAGFLYRRYKHHGIDLDTLSSEIGVSKKKVKHLIDTYQFMIDHDDQDVNRWSYYDEYLKSSKIKKARQNFESLDAVVVQQIKCGDISKAVAIRDDLPKLCKGPSKYLKKYVEGAYTFAEACEAAHDAGSDNHELARLAKFRAWVVKPEVEEALEKSKGQQRSKILYELDKLYGRIQSLRKNLAG